MKENKTKDHYSKYKPKSFVISHVNRGGIADCRFQRGTGHSASKRELLAVGMTSSDHYRAPKYVVGFAYKNNERKTIRIKNITSITTIG